MSKFDSKTFNPQAFGAYVDKVPNVTRNELAKSKAVGSNAQARAALSSQTGALYVKVPYFGRISGATSQNNDGDTNMTSTSTTTYEQGFVVASRMDSWTEKSFSKNITAGVDFMDNVAEQIGDYKLDVRQLMMLAMLSGVFSMGTTGDTVQATAAAEFITKHTLDITAVDDGCVTATSLNKAIQQASGDNKSIFKLVCLHSTVATNLENLKLMKYMTYTDKDGIERELALGTWNGRLVLVDDNMPAEDEYVLSTDTSASSSKTYYKLEDGAYVEVASATTPVTNGYYEATGNEVYTSYVLGEGSVILDDIGDAVPYEMDRDPNTNGGQDTLYVRDRYVCGLEGISFEKPTSLTASASNADLASGANWAVINDGTSAISHKAVPIARVKSLG